MSEYDFLLSHIKNFELCCRLLTYIVPNLYGFISFMQRKKKHSRKCLAESPSCFFSGIQCKWMRIDAFWAQNTKQKKVQTCPYNNIFQFFWSHVIAFCDNRTEIYSVCSQKCRHIVPWCFDISDAKLHLFSNIHFFFFLAEALNVRTSPGHLFVRWHQLVPYLPSSDWTWTAAKLEAVLKIMPYIRSDLPRICA